MGFNLGLGMRAANAYFQAGDAQKVRDQEQRRWDVENKKSEAGLSTLADQTEADRARFRANAAQDSSSLSLQPLKTQAQQDAWNAKIKDQQFAESQRMSLETHARNQNQSALDIQPTQLQTAETAAQTALSNAKVGQADAQVAEGGIDQRVSMGKQKQAVADYTQHKASVSAVADAFVNKDEAGMIKLLNGIKSASGQGGEDIASVRNVPNPQNPNEILVVAFDANGNKVGDSIPAESLKKMAALNAKPAEIIKYDADQNVAAYSGGVWTPLAKADPSASKAKMGPLERDSNFLVEKFGMTKEQALSVLTSAKTMTKQQFVTKAIQDQAAKYGEVPTKEYADSLGALYDYASGGAQTAPAKPAAPVAQQPAAALPSPGSKPKFDSDNLIFGR